MNNEELIKEYRKQLLMVHAGTVAIVSVAEIAAYFIFVHMGLHSLSLRSHYLWLNVVFPIILNFLAHMAARWLCKSESVNHNLKNYSIIYAMIATSFVVSLIHRDYIVTGCSYVFPIILSALYNDKVILKQSLWSSLILVSVSVATLFAERKIDVTMLINIIVVYGLIAVSYLCGILSINFSERNFSLIEKQAMENDRLEEEIDLDQMTGLFNHEAFYERLVPAIENSENGTKDLSLVMIDIDDFKNINDTYGHDEGDDVLKALAGILKGVCDENDYACRFGGEEFALILCGKSLEKAEEIVRSAMKNFYEYRFEFTDKSLTFSSGIAKYQADETIETFFDRADDNLYTSKKTGKNKITK